MSGTESDAGPYSTKPKFYALKVGKNLFQRIHRHVSLLSVLEEDQVAKSTWIAKAIEEKLEKESGPEATEHHAARMIRVRLADDVDLRFESQMQALKKAYGTFSKRQWILEAIHEKLSRDESGALEEVSNLT